MRHGSKRPTAPPFGSPDDDHASIPPQELEYLGPGLFSANSSLNLAPKALLAADLKAKASSSGLRSPASL